MDSAHSYYRVLLGVQAYFVKPDIGVFVLFSNFNSVPLLLTLYFTPKIMSSKVLELKVSSNVEHS